MRNLNIAIIGIVSIIALLVILNLLIKEPTYEEVLQKSMLAMASTRNINLSYELGVGYETGDNTVTSNGTANYTKNEGAAGWKYSIMSEIGTIYDINPEELVSLMTDVDLGEYGGVFQTTNGCYRVYAVKAVNQTFKGENHLGGYDYIRFTACFDRATGYPWQYTIGVSNSVKYKSGIALYNTRDLL